MSPVDLTSALHILDTLTASCPDELTRLRGQVTQTVEALHHSRELLQVTLHSIADAVITTDAGGHVLWMNPAAERMTGWCHGACRSACIPCTAVWPSVVRCAAASRCG